MEIRGFFGKHRFLSNFWLTSIHYDGIYYPSSEHAFQAAKFLDKEVKVKIASYKTPKEAKKAGKIFKPLREDWEQVKDRVMQEIVMIKFSNRELMKKLLDTGSQKLIEENTWGDQYWGICNNQGKNKLGEILMIVRDFYNDKN